MAHILQYDLRPAKQVERRMLLDAFQILLAAGFPIRDYKYLGMGSVFFWDFIVFHKLLGIRSLTSAESDETIKRRVNFNRPFRLVNVVVAPIGTLLAGLSRRERHLVWLDYDTRLSAVMLADARQAGTKLGAGSICLITVDLSPPSLPASRDMMVERVDYYREMSGDLWKPSWRPADWADAMLGQRITDLLVSALKEGGQGQGRQFIPMFHFEYRDGDHPMMTVGGMFGGTAERGRLRRSEIKGAVYFRSNFSDPYRIRVPRLTRRERHSLDHAMPRDGKWLPDDFEAIEADLAAYSEIYRFLPAYAELLL